MRILLDTHALLWWLSDSDRLGQCARNLIADPANDVLISAASVWEIVVKVRVGKLVADVDEIFLACEQNGFTLLHITQGHLKSLSMLPMHHRDPFDHLLIAQAIAEQAIFVTEDRNAALYRVGVMTCANAL